MRKNKGYNACSLKVNGQYLDTMEGTFKLQEKENIIELRFLRVRSKNDNGDNDDIEIEEEYDDGDDKDDDVDDGDDGDDENDSENN